MADGRPFVDRILSQKGHLIHKIKAKDSSGQWAYYFLLVEPRKEAAFLEQLKNRKISNLEEFGTIIASCYGEEPTDEIKALLKEKYGFDLHNS